MFIYLHFFVYGYVCNMAIFFQKRVLTEKISKMFKRIGIEIIAKEIIMVTNKHAVLFYDNYETQCAVVLTFLEEDASTEFNNAKATTFYVESSKANIDYGGLMLCNQNNFVSSGFREFLTNNINDDSVWLVIDKLCQYGSIISENLSKHLANEISLKELKENINNNGLEYMELINKNSYRITNNMFWDKFTFKKLKD